jgi:hypothetical protein
LEKVPAIAFYKMKKLRLYPTPELRNIRPPPPHPVIKPPCPLLHMTCHFYETNGTTL